MPENEQNKVIIAPTKFTTVQKIAIALAITTSGVATVAVVLLTRRLNSVDNTVINILEVLEDSGIIHNLKIGK